MKLFFLSLLLASCAHTQKKTVESELTAEAPSWIYSPYELCQENLELCATGEGKSLNQADGMARSNLASIFEVKIESELNSFSSSQQSFPWQGDVRSEVQHSLKESVQQVLEGVEIKKRFKSKGLTYALASLDRSKASGLLGGRLDKIDQELNVLWNKRSRTNLRRIVRLYLEREKLNERYSIVSSSPRPSPMTYKDIVEWRQSKPVVEPLTLKVSDTVPDWMSLKIKELLTEAGFKIVSGDTKKALSMEVYSIREYLNVSGFEKYTFNLNLTSYDNGEKHKVVSTSETVTGRSQADALLKVKSFFNDYIEQHLSDLGLD